MEMADTCTFKTKSKFFLVGGFWSHSILNGPTFPHLALKLKKIIKYIYIDDWDEEVFRN